MADLKTSKVNFRKEVTTHITVLAQKILIEQNSKFVWICFINSVSTRTEYGDWGQDARDSIANEQKRNWVMS